MTEHNCAWITTIRPEDATGGLEAIYRRVKLDEDVANILRSQSLDPRALDLHVQLYLHLMFGKSSLSRREREMIAVVVSRANGCRYCVAHHTAALRAVSSEDEDEPSTAREHAMVGYARTLTWSPGSIGEADLLPLRKAGLDDEAILHVAQIVAYFNFVNRLAQGLGVELEADHERFVRSRT